MISVDKVAAVFGCWTTVSRKSVLPVFEEINSILFYPVQYEGQECSRNVFYTGAAPNQQAIPAVDYLMNEDKVKRWVLAGTDYVYPRTTNQILEAYLKSKGVAADDIMINYTPFGHSDWQNIVAPIKKFGSAGKKTAVVSTINGDANVPFYKELGNQGIKATDIPVVAFSVGEEELAGIDTTPLVGHLAAWNYFESVDTPGQHRLHRRLEDLHQEPEAHHQRPDGSALYRLQHVGEGASRKPAPPTPDAVIDAMIGVVRAEPDRRLFDHDAQPSHHQAGADRRDPGERPVQRRLADARPGGRPGMVALRRRYQGPDRRLAGADEMRCVQREDRHVHRRQEGLTPLLPERGRPLSSRPPLTFGLTSVVGGKECSEHAAISRHAYDSRG